MALSENKKNKVKENNLKNKTKKRADFPLPQVKVKNLTIQLWHFDLLFLIVH